MLSYRPRLRDRFETLGQQLENNLISKNLKKSERFQKISIPWLRRLLSKSNVSIS